MEHKEKFEKLYEGQSFEFEKQRFDVTETRYQTGRYFIYTLQQRTFVKDNDQFAAFYNQIKLITVSTPPAPQWVPDKQQLPTKPLTLWMQKQKPL